MNGDKDMRNGYPPEWSKVRRQIITRDGLFCVLCQVAPLELVHHINGNKTDCRGDNLIGVCWRCHGTLHKGGRRKRVFEQAVAVYMECGIRPTPPLTHPETNWAIEMKKQSQRAFEKLYPEPTHEQMQATLDRMYD